MHPTQEHPTITGIIAVAAAVFVWDSTAGPYVHVEYGVTPIHVEQAWDDLLHGDFASAKPTALLTMISALFLHGGPMHLIMNMVFLWMFGSLVSRHLGRWWALAAFFVCGIGGFVLHVVLNRGSDIPCIGASGAISGYEGVYLGLALRWQLDWPDVWPLARPVPPSQLAIFAVVGIAADFYGLSQSGQGIAFGAHIGGFATGLAIAGGITQIYPTLQRWNTNGRRSR